MSSRVRAFCSLAVAEEKPDQLALHYYVAESLREKGRHA